MSTSATEAEPQPDDRPQAEDGPRPVDEPLAEAEAEPEEEPEEPRCGNCETTLTGPFCHSCGQENIELKESVWDIIAHFFQDITHFDGKFFSSLKYLVTRPGFLSTEYMIGRRASYINPIRMYIFTSAFFFLIFFSFIKINEKSIVTTYMNGKTFAQIEAMDSLAFDAFTKNVNKEDGKKANAHDQG